MVRCVVRLPSRVSTSRRDIVRLFFLRCHGENTHHSYHALPSQLRCPRHCCYCRPTRGCAFQLSRDEPFRRRGMRSCPGRRRYAGRSPLLALLYPLQVSGTRSKIGGVVDVVGYVLQGCMIDRCPPIVIYRLSVHQCPMDVNMDVAGVATRCVMMGPSGDNRRKVSWPLKDGP